MNNNYANTYLFYTQNYANKYLFYPKIYLLKKILISWGFAAETLGRLSLTQPYFILVLYSDRIILFIEYTIQ